MKVYLVHGCYHSPGEDIFLGAFSSLEKAKSHTQSLYYQGVHWKADEPCWMFEPNMGALHVGEPRYDWVAIDEVPVQ